MIGGDGGADSENALKRAATLQVDGVGML